MQAELVSSKLDKVVNMAIEYAPKVLMAIVVFIIGMWIIGRVVKALGKYLSKIGMDESLRPFLLSMVGVLLKVMLLFSIAGMVGIQTTSFVAMLAAASFAIGMALQGSLGNFAAGVMILFFKPYRVGDLIDVQGQVGNVDEIQIFNTILTSPDHKKIIIPNAQATSGVVTNLSEKKHLRVDLNVSVAYTEDYDKVEKIILEALRNTPGVMTDPAPFVGIEKFDTHNMLLSVRPHSTTEDYWDVYFNSYKNVKRALGQAGVQVAYAEGVTFGAIG